jgi:hypothetical protein
MEEAMTPTDERKVDMIQHIVHDWGKLVEIFTTPERRPSPLNHAVERAFLVECRKFANFFQNKRGPMKDPLQQDAIAKDFVGKRFRPELHVWKKWEDHINRQLMHLSYGRVDNTDSWDGSANKPIFEELCVVWDEFLHAWIRNLGLSSTYEGASSEKLSQCRLFDATRTLSASWI